MQLHLSLSLCHLLHHDVILQFRWQRHLFQVCLQVAAQHSPDVFTTQLLQTLWRRRNPLQPVQQRSVFEHCARQPPLADATEVTADVCTSLRQWPQQIHVTFMQGKREDRIFLSADLQRAISSAIREMNKVIFGGLPL